MFFFFDSLILNHSCLVLFLAHLHLHPPPRSNLKLREDPSQHTLGAGIDGGIDHVGHGRPWLALMGFGRAKGDGVDRVMVFDLDLLKVLKINQPGGGFNPSEKYESNWKSSPSRGENEQYSKPPPSQP